MTRAAMTSVRTSRVNKPDQACVEAVELARAAAVEIGVEMVGEHLGLSVDEERVVTHRFASLQPGYRGWAWAVTVARASRSKLVTVDEVCLLPDDGAMLAPAWVPWSERLRPGDLGVGDLMPTTADDERLVPAYVMSDEDPDVREVADELGLGRERVMSRFGRLDAAERWRDGDGGPDTPMAKQAPAKCGSCGFWLVLGGSLGGLFGACGNEYAPRDGMVVAADYGCGAHSQVMVEPVVEAVGTATFEDDGEVEARAVPITN